MAISLVETLIVALGGATGAVSRFLVQQSNLCSPKTGNTVVVNLLGCLVIGIAWALLNHFNVSVKLNRFIIAGFLGGFTTFSSFALDIVAMANDGKMREALLYLTVSVVGGILLCFLAMKGTSAILDPH